MHWSIIPELRSSQLTIHPYKLCGETLAWLMATRRQSRVRAHWALLLLVGVPSRSARSPDLRYVFHMSYVFANFRNLPMDAVVVFLPVFYVTSDRHVASCRSRASFRRPGLGPGLMMFDVDVPMRKKTIETMELRKTPRFTHLQ